MIPTEAEEQITLFEWAEWAQNRYPELRLLHHIPNGGSRHPAEAMRLKREGVKAGVPDICLPVARNGYNGLYIELKRTKGGTVSAHQKAWIEMLTEQGYRAVVCKGCVDAIAEIERYLEK